MKKTIPLHQNESYWLLDDKLTGLIKEEFGSASFSTYPNYSELISSLSSYAGATPETICMAPGSDAAISIITELCAQKGMTIVLPVPTFYGYERILARNRATVVPTYYSEKNGVFEFPLQDTIDAIQENTALYLCHPNNPLGCTIPEEDLDALFEAAKEKDAIVVLDEAYYEFGGTTHVDRVHDQPMVVLRTLSKAFGLSGARIGYAVSSPDIIRSMQKLQLPWPISHTSAVAALTLLTHEKEVIERRSLVLKARADFKEALSGIEGIEAFASSTNFVLIRMDKAAEAAQALEEKGILVAKTDFMSGYEMARELLSSTLRMAVPSPSDKKAVLSAIKDITLQLSSIVV